MLDPEWAVSKDFWKNAESLLEWLSSGVQQPIKPQQNAGTRYCHVVAEMGEIWVTVWWCGGVVVDACTALITWGRFHLLLFYFDW